ncbi:uncharacterized protein EV420DRAFT_1752874, partial [Desarmillaria tabescens]
MESNVLVYLCRGRAGSSGVYEKALSSKATPLSTQHIQEYQSRISLNPIINRNAPNFASANHIGQVEPMDLTTHVHVV